MNLQEKLRSGQKIYGTMIRVVRNPALAYLAKNAGLDFVMYDCEHSNYNFESLHDLFITGNALGFPALVRVPIPTKDYISRSLDSGASGVMAPMTDTPGLAREIVKWSKYQPLGERGYSTGCAHINFEGAARHTEVMEEANGRILSIAQIETKTAVDNAEKIAAVAGIDALLIGPNDLSLSLGVPGDLMNPIELEAIAHVAAACKKQGKAFGLHAGVKMIARFIGDLQLVMSDTDTSILERGFRSVKDSLTAL